MVFFFFFIYQLDFKYISRLLLFLFVFDLFSHLVHRVRGSILSVYWICIYITWNMFDSKRLLWNMYKVFLLPLGITLEENEYLKNTRRWFVSVGRCPPPPHHNLIGIKFLRVFFCSARSALTENSGRRETDVLFLFFFSRGAPEYTCYRRFSVRRRRQHARSDFVGSPRPLVAVWPRCPV